MSEYRITQARPTDLRLLASIEIAAARLLSGHAPADVLNETTSEDELDDARRRGQLWVALAGDAPVGFAHVKVLEPAAAHLEEIDVHPDHARRGIGTRLIAAILAWAADAGYRAVTLTTFRDVPVEHAVLRTVWIRSRTDRRAQPGFAFDRRRRSPSRPGPEAPGRHALCAWT